MNIADKHPQENLRLETLDALEILDTMPELEFDQITRLASHICETPIALISLVDGERQWFKSKIGLEAEQTPRDYAFCAHAILQEEVFQVNDSREDKRFSDNPLVQNVPHVLFYAGAPLLGPNNMPIGTLCVIDNKPKKLTANQAEMLKILSAQLSKLLLLRQQNNERKRTEQTLIQTAKMSSLGEMAGGLAHEINSPLAVIGVCNEQIRRLTESDSIDKEKIINKVEKIDYTIQRIAKIIRSLRAFAKGAEDTAPSITRVETFVQDAVILCAEKFKHQGIPIKFEIDSTLEVLCISQHMSQVVFNLISNSFDAIMDLPDRWVKIIAERRRDGRVLIAVIDSGQGISEDIRDKIMHPFFTTKEIGSGTGLGLSVSKGIVESFKGEFFYNQNSPHTRFDIILPAGKLG